MQAGDDERQMKQTNPSKIRRIQEFTKGSTLGQGTYGIVFLAHDRTTNQKLAIKKLKLLNANSGFPITSLRQISLLSTLSHPNIIQFLGPAIGHKAENLFLLFEFCECDLYRLLGQMSIDKCTLSEGEVKCLALQLVKGVSYAHGKYVIHRDLKLSNLLLTKKGILKIADFGLARQFESPYKPITRKVVTLWYRPPELLLKVKEYGPSVDVWSVGCIIAQLVRNGEPLLQGKTETHQFQLICELIGYPSKQDWPEYYTLVNEHIFKEFTRFSNLTKPLLPALFNSPSLLDLLTRMLQWDPSKRISLEEVLYHRYFYQTPKAVFPDEIRCLNRLQSYGKSKQDKK